MQKTLLRTSVLSFTLAFCIIIIEQLKMTKQIILLFLMPAMLLTFTEALKLFHLKTSSATFYYKEAADGTCASDDQCDGLRTCVSKKCAGESRPAKSEAYYYDESKTSIRCPLPADANVAVKDYFCDGARTCSDFGWCQGTAREPKT